MGSLRRTLFQKGEGSAKMFGMSLEAKRRPCSEFTVLQLEQRVDSTAGPTESLGRTSRHGSKVHWHNVDPIELTPGYHYGGVPLQQ